MPSLRLIVDIEKKTLLARAGLLAGIQSPTFHSGDSIDLEVSLVRGTSLSDLPFEPVALEAGEEVSVLTGVESNTPSGGTFTITDGSGNALTFPFDATATQLEEMNTLGDVVSSGAPLLVEAFGSGFLVTHQLNNSTLVLNVDDSELVPNSAGAFLDAVASSPTTFPVWLLRFKRQAVASATLTNSTTTPTGSATPVVAWVSAGVPAVVEVDTSGAASGFVNLVFSGLDGDGNPATYSAQVFAGSSAQSVTSAIRAGFTGATGSLVRVETIRAGVYRITSTYEPQALAVNDGWATENNLVGYERNTGTLDLTSVDVEENLAGEKSVVAALEVRLTDGSGNSRTLAAVPTQLISRLVQ
jgi:hypothetical protein